MQSDSRPVLRIGGLPLFDFGKVAVGALQLLTPLPAVVVVRAPCQFGALFGLSSQEFHRSHVGTPHSPAFALQHLLFCDATKIALPLNRFRIGLEMTALGAMKVATCPKTGAPSHNKYAAVSGALGSALPWRQSNRARRRIIRFHRPLLACAWRLRACESGPGPRSAIHPVVPELMRKGGRRYKKLARSAQGRHRGSRGIRQDRSHGLAVQAHARSLRHSRDYQ